MWQLAFMSGKDIWISSLSGCISQWLASSRSHTTIRWAVVLTGSRFTLQFIEFGRTKTTETKAMMHYCTRERFEETVKTRGGHKHISQVDHAVAYEQ